MPHRRIWRILLQDNVALTEVMGGLMLVTLRGAVLLGSARMLSPGSDVADLLEEIGVTEERWGIYLIICGMIQIFLARTSHTVVRALINLAILAGFVVMGAGYYRASHTWHSIPASVICMAVFYTFLLARVGLDRRRALRASGRLATDGV